MSLFVFLSMLLFSCGLALCFTKRNIILILIGIELILNGANINFIYFSQQNDQIPQGQTIVLFILVIAGAQASVALAIVLNLYRRFGTVLPDKIRELKK